MSSQVENTAENREKLASFVVESWDLDTLIEVAVRNLEKHYASDDEAFQSDWSSSYLAEEEA